MGHWGMGKSGMGKSGIGHCGKDRQGLGWLRYLAAINWFALSWLGLNQFASNRLGLNRLSWLSRLSQLSWRCCLSGLLCLCFVSGCQPAADNSTDGTSQVEVEQGNPNAAVVFDRQRALTQYANQPLTVLDISERQLEGRNRLAVLLSVPLDPSLNHQQYIQLVDLSDNNKLDGQWRLDASAKMLWFDLIEPTTEYQLVIRAGLTAVTGAVLADGVVETVKTKPLPASLTFATRGHFLAKGINTGLPIRAVNVSGAQIDFFRIAPSNYSEFLTRVSRSYAYWSLDRITALGELVYSGRYDLSAAANQRVERLIELEQVTELQSAGVYLAVMHQPGKYKGGTMLWYSVTDLALHLRQYSKQMELYVHSIASGLPQPDVSVELYQRKANKAQLLARQQTNDQGLAQLPVAAINAGLIVARTDEQVSVLSIQHTGLDLSQFDLGQRPQLEQELFIYGSRDLYRPGESVLLQGLLRSADGRLLNSPVLQAKLFNPKGQLAHEFRWQPQQLAHYQYRWQTNANTELGQWRLRVSGPFAEPIEYKFRIEQFLPERMRLTFNPTESLAESDVGGELADTAVVSKGKLQLAVLGEYLYGAVASDHKLDTVLVERIARNPVASLAEFEFGDQLAQSPRGQRKLPAQRLDQRGRARIRAELTEVENAVTKVNVITSLYEPGGRDVTRSYSVLHWSQPQMFGIAARYAALAGTEFAPANGELEFALIHADAQGKLYSAADVELSLIREERQYYWSYSENDGWHYQWRDKEYPVQKQLVQLSAEGETRVKVLVEHGHYRLQLKQSSSGKVTSYRFHAGQDWYVSWQRAQAGSAAARPDQLTMAWDKGAYQAGEQAQLTIVPPAAGRVLVLIEGQQVEFRTEIEIGAAGKTITIPIEGDWQRHDLYAAALWWQPAQSLSQPISGSQPVLAQRSLGLLHLPLQRQQRQLALQLELAEQLLPNQQVIAKFSLAHTSAESSAQGSGESSAKTLAESSASEQPVMVTVSLVDQGILSLTDFVTPDPHQYFFQPRRYQVQAQDIYHQMIQPLDAKLARLRFGGDAADLAQKKAATQQAKLVTLEYGPLLMQGGQLELPIQLPDFDGELRLMAVAFSEDSFGSTEQSVTLASPVVAQMILPRFVADNDQLVAQLQLDNLTDQAQQLSVQITAEPAQVLSPAISQQLELPAKQKRQLAIPLTLEGQLQPVQLKLTVDGVRSEQPTQLENQQQAQLNKQYQLPVRPSYPEISRQQRSWLKAGQSFQLEPSLYQDLMAHSLQANIVVSSEIDLQPQQQLQTLLNYGYQCLEQTGAQLIAVSYLLANRNHSQLALKSELSLAEQKQRYQQLVARLQGLQQNHGGFALWQRTGDEQHYLTVFATDVLLQAEQLGLAVPFDLKQKALKRLQYYLSQPGRLMAERYSEDPANYRFSYRAYASYVLAKLKRAPLSQLRRLFDRQLSSSKTALGQLHLSLALKLMGDQKRAQQGLERVRLLAAQQQLRNDDYLADFGSQTRDLAQLVYLLKQHQWAPELKAELLMILQQQLYRQQWFSTQERAHLLLAATANQGQAAEQSNSDIVDLKVQLGQQSMELNQQASYQQQLDATALAAGFSVSTSTEGGAYVSAVVTGYPQQPPTAVQHGFQLQKFWYDLQGKPLQRKQINHGELLLVELEFSAEQRTPDGLLVDLLPAGFELQNPALSKGLDIAQLKLGDKTIAQLQTGQWLEHLEYRDDRFVAAVDLPAKRTGRLFYLVRAVTEGVFARPAALIEDMYAPRYRANSDSAEPLTVVVD